MPAVHLVEENLKKETWFKKTFFHELAHLLGYWHDEKKLFDVPTLTDQCCFGSDNIGDPSCEALSKMPIN
ncbi:MAG TPA: hypothetical protein DCL41_01690 [Bdellovibrionales bacterium]|nr:hypothetical protein [Bdellovibrionales bacterium]